MDTTTKTRHITILCDAGRHAYCLQGCECSCHFDLEIDGKLTDFAYELWTIRTAFALPEESAETRRGRLRGVIRSAENSVNFWGYSVDEITDRMELTLARDYWSLRETSEDFNIDLHTALRIS